MKKISVIVPVYNTEKYLENCVNSILSQNFDDFEIILINDGSKDNSLLTANKFEEKYPDKVKVISQENKGLGGARNTGIDAACGKYLLFVDSDDSIKPDLLSYLYSVAEEKNADTVIFGFDSVTEDGKIISTEKISENVAVIEDTNKTVLVSSLSTAAWNKLFRTEIFKENNIYFPERLWYEDLDTVLKTALYSKKTVLTDKIGYNYLQRSGSIMNTPNIEKNRDILTVIKDVVSYYKENGVFEKYQKELEFTAVFHIMILASMRISEIDPKSPLLSEFYDYIKTTFPDFEKNPLIKTELSKKRKIMLSLSKMKLYGVIKAINKAYKHIR